MKIFVFVILGLLAFKTYGQGFDYSTNMMSPANPANPSSPLNSSNPISPSNPLNPAYESSDSDKECAEGAIYYGINPNHTLAVRLNQLPANDKKYKLSVSLCNSKQCNSIKDSAAFNFEETDTNIIKVSALKLGCEMYENQDQRFTYLRFRIFQKTPFYKEDIMVGQNFIPLNNLITSAMNIPLSRSTAIQVGFK